MAFHWKFSKMHTATKWTIHLDFIESSKGFSILDGYLVPVESSKVLHLCRDIPEGVKDDTWDLSITNAPVSKRAWIVQERFLSPRILYFVEGELFWECAELCASESCPFGIPNFEETSRSCSPLDNALRIWYNSVEIYTKANLTKASDKLVAISAIARELKPSMKSRYFAGLWRDNLVPQLAWNCFREYGSTREFNYPREVVFVNGGGATRVWLYGDEYDMRLTRSTNHLTCLPLDIRRLGGLCFNGLILECVDVAENVYRRIGVLSNTRCSSSSNLTDEEFFKDPLISAIKIFEKRKDGVPFSKRESSFLREIMMVILELLERLELVRLYKSNTLFLGHP
ncbi:hypothetical protein SS1G_02414 [Sclerotinia sclerotiorum 1980 UF-70]|uniref:Heterokaryon incompatibility domain-containing protein n=1 Tax=Sclerotinia sclerotiorum (strain ATCC 18683 / 1980 / Ss-1) TaxID=665079 RepID=A7EAT2_SCLS1|nr:hypothetical protein SS1G_02414 [Sclerotinia sclerotiorum 1980 UF-70]EDN99560.1 hypothetical protein SS1G_02414 [Sclerotinia sclerotiorum 1980 UF-70]